MPEQTADQTPGSTAPVETPEARADGSRAEVAETRAERDARFERDALPFLDHETDDARRAVIAEHLEDCSGCLRQFGIEQEFKALVRRRCGGDVPPPGLKDRIKLQLTSVSFEEDGTQVSVERVTVERTQESPTA